MCAQWNFYQVNLKVEWHKVDLNFDFDRPLQKKC